MNFSYNQLPIYRDDTRDTITERYAALIWRFSDTKEIQSHLLHLYEIAYSKGISDRDKINQQLND